MVACFDASDQPLFRRSGRNQEAFPILFEALRLARLVRAAGCAFAPNSACSVAAAQAVCASRSVGRLLLAVARASRGRLMR